MKSLKMTCAGEMLELFAARAMFWERSKTLFAADVHLGKASAFRHAGIPVPEQNATDKIFFSFRSLHNEFHAGAAQCCLDLFTVWIGPSQHFQSG